MTEAELKKIHGDNVELAPDTSKDAKLTEKQAIALARREGLEPVDEWVVVNETEEVGVYDTKAKAEKALKEGEALLQRRHMRRIE